MSTFLGIPLSSHEENILTGVIIDVADKTHTSLSEEAVLHKLIDIVSEKNKLEVQLRQIKHELWTVKKELSQMNQDRYIVSDISSSSKYTIAPAEELRMLCIENNLFTCADNKQYERFFEMNEKGAELGLLTSYAYACNDDISYSDVYDIFEKASKEYGGDVAKEIDL